MTDWRKKNPGLNRDLRISPSPWALGSQTYLLAQLWKGKGLSPSIMIQYRRGVYGGLVELCYNSESVLKLFKVGRGFYVGLQGTC